ncbi:uncharacterized protein LOC135819774 [Sycon ciliatum]|uniref:uncharacterized protein LOC135819774 n=1 Tax=Sycon ciliatum TaxID=27933 RepID=UPI0031F6F49B
MTFQCDVNATCVDNIGSYTCRCNAGYTGNGKTCSDTDECSIGLHSCAGNATCANSVGSYNCNCNVGYEGIGTICSNANECLTGKHQCDGNATCVDTVGSYTCTCNAGYMGNGSHCSNADECVSGKYQCHGNATCMDTVGSYACECNTGYMGNGTFCSDVNECNSGEHRCDGNATCTNSVGSYKCECNIAYQGNGTHCTLESKFCGPFSLPNLADTIASIDTLGKLGDRIVIACALGYYLIKGTNYTDVYTCSIQNDQGRWQGDATCMIEEAASPLTSTYVIAISVSSSSLLLGFIVIAFLIKSRQHQHADSLNIKKSGAGAMARRKRESTSSVTTMLTEVGGEDKPGMTKQDSKLNKSASVSYQNQNGKANATHSTAADGKAQYYNGAGQRLDGEMEIYNDLKYQSAKYVAVAGAQSEDEYILADSQLYHEAKGSRNAGIAGIYEGSYVEAKHGMDSTWYNDVFPEARGQTSGEFNGNRVSKSSSHGDLCTGGKYEKPSVQKRHAGYSNEVTGDDNYPYGNSMSPPEHHGLAPDSAFGLDVSWNASRWGSDYLYGNSVSPTDSRSASPEKKHRKSAPVRKRRDDDSNMWVAGSQGVSAASDGDLYGNELSPSTSLSHITTIGNAGSDGGSTSHPRLTRAGKGQQKPNVRTDGDYLRSLDIHSSAEVTAKKRSKPTGAKGGHAYMAPKDCKYESGIDYCRPVSTGTTATAMSVSNGGNDGQAYMETGDALYRSRMEGSSRPSTTGKGTRHSKPVSDSHAYVATAGLDSAYGLIGNDSFAQTRKQTTLSNTNSSSKTKNTVGRIDALASTGTSEPKSKQGYEKARRKPDGLYVELSERK